LWFSIGGRAPRRFVLLGAAVGAGTQMAMLLVVHFLSSSAFIVPSHRLATRLTPTFSHLMMSDTDDLGVPDPNFGSDELERTWYRTGKGKARWQAGDKTGDSALDERLLWSALVLSPPSLHIRDGLHAESLQATLALGWLKLPYKVVAYSDEQSPGLMRTADVPVTFKALDNADGPIPRLSGKNLPMEGDIISALEICSFAAGVAKDAKLAPATGRTDLAAWIADEDALPDDFAPLLRGRFTDGAPVLNIWGLSMDDAMALPILVRRIDACKRAPTESMVKDYIDTCFELAGLGSLFGGSDTE